MIIIKKALLSLVVVLFFVSLIFAAHQNGRLKSSLASKNNICIARERGMVEQFERDLEYLRYNINSRVLVQVKGVSDIVSEKEPIIEENENYLFRATLGDYSESIEDIVAKKYYFLLKYLNLDENAEHKLIELLQMREQLALKIMDSKEYFQELGLAKEDIWNMERLLRDIDEQIEALLDAEHRVRYVMLRNSDVEQKQFNQYALGLNGLFPLDSEQQESVLFARLKQKEIFEKALESSGINMDYPLTQEQRDSLRKKVEFAAKRYKYSFLINARNVLDHDNYPMDQYTLLENYTNTEFNYLMRDLQEKIDSRGLIN
jgi:hypothetical protein